MTAKAWPFEEARKVLARYQGQPPSKGYVLFQTGYGPSGLPHIGTFAEVARTTMVRRAFEWLSDIPTRLLCFSDDMDGLRKVPDNIPNPQAIAPDLGKPLSKVRNPFGTTHASFAHHNNARLCAFLDRFGFAYRFASASAYYHSGRFDAMLIRACEQYDKIMAIMLPTLREERRATYAPFLPISPKSGKVLQVPLQEVNPRKGTLVYQEPDGERIEIPVTGGHVKMQWKADWAMRWAALGVDYEMSGKDLIASVKDSAKICRTLGARPPASLTYELFNDEHGRKISKSKGNGLSLEEWLAYGSSESLCYFLYQKPKTAKRLHFDVIPKAMDDYHQQLRACKQQDEPARLNNPVFHIHGAQIPQSGMVVSFSMLLNLVSAAGVEDKAQLWAFIRRYAPAATPKNLPDMEAAVGFAIRYFHDHLRPQKRYRLPTEAERTALVDLRNQLQAWEGAADAEALQSLVFRVGCAHFAAQGAWFNALYEVLLGVAQGPRFGRFIAIYGIEATVALIDGALTRKQPTPTPQKIQ